MHKMELLDENDDICGFKIKKEITDEDELSDENTPSEMDDEEADVPLATRLRVKPSFPTFGNIKTDKSDWSGDSEDDDDEDTYVDYKKKTKRKRMPKNVKKKAKSKKSNASDDVYSHNTVGRKNQSKRKQTVPEIDEVPISYSAVQAKIREIKRSKSESEEDAADNGDTEQRDNGSDDGNAPAKIKQKRKRNADDVLIECHVCGQQFYNKDSYEEHMLGHTDELPHRCQVESCKKGFTTAGRLRLHVDHAHSELAEVHKCTVEGCEESFPRWRQLGGHLKKAHNISMKSLPPRKYPCPHCPKIYCTPTAYKNHMYKHNGKELPYPCTVCEMRFVTNHDLKTHLLRHAGIKNHICPYCGIAKTTPQEWKKHVRTHTRENNLTCTYCEQTFENKRLLNNHVRTVHERNKDSTCQYCGKVFRKAKTCQTHELSHTGEMPFECNLCGRKYMYQKLLLRHLKTHEEPTTTTPATQETFCKQEAGTQEPNLYDMIAGNTATGTDNVSNSKISDEILEICAESVVSELRGPRRVERVDISALAGTAINPIPSVSVPSWSLLMDLTNKEGKHICPVCGKCFNFTGNMMTHYRNIHERIKDFACRFCEKRFAKAQTLKHHEWTHTGEKPYECTVCGNRFRQDMALKRHMKVHQEKSDAKPEDISDAKHKKEADGKKVDVSDAKPQEESEEEDEDEEEEEEEEEEDEEDEDESEDEYEIKDQDKSKTSDKPETNTEAKPEQ